MLAAQQVSLQRASSLGRALDSAQEQRWWEDGWWEG